MQTEYQSSSTRIEAFNGSLFSAIGLTAFNLMKTFQSSPGIRTSRRYNDLNFRSIDLRRRGEEKWKLKFAGYRKTM